MQKYQSNEEIEPCLSVVIPVYNEAKTISSVMDSVLGQRPVKEIVLVDDCSTDSSWDILTQYAQKYPQIQVHRHPQNQGKGTALRTGFQFVQGPYVIIQDADLEYDPSEYYLLLAPALLGLADVVFGSRFLGSGSHRVLYYWHSLGNKLLTTLSNMATNINITDMETCYKLFHIDILKQISLRENRFGIEPELTAKISHLQPRMYEVPISYHGRTYSQGKKINWKDGVSALRCIIKYGILKRP